MMHFIYIFTFSHSINHIIYSDSILKEFVYSAAIIDMWNTLNGRISKTEKDYIKRDMKH